MKFLIAFCLLFSGIICFAQPVSDQPPYKRFPSLPPIEILLGDSTSLFTKEKLPPGKASLYIIFSPECSHCQHETEEIIAHKEELKDVEIVMITMHPLWMMNDFVTKYNLKDFPNMIIGRDTHYTSPTFFEIRSLPFMAMYDKKGNLISGFEGTLDIAKVIETFKANQ
jgi:thioredoxin-related protein